VISGHELAQKMSDVLYGTEQLHGVHEEMNISEGRINQPRIPQWLVFNAL